MLFRWFNYKIEDFVINNILIDKKLIKIISVYNISYKNLIDFRPLHIRFDNIDSFIRVYDGTKYLVLLRSEKQDSIYSRIRYLISVKSRIKYMISHIYAKVG